MQSKLLLSVATVTAIFFGCSGNSNTAKNENIKTSGDTTSTTAAAIKMPDAHYKAAFEGQTRIKAVTTTTGYKVEKIAEKLGRPWAIIALPDGKLLLTEKSGYMKIHNADGALVKKITGFPKVDDNGQGGLLDVALDPDFATNKTIYWSFAEKYGKGNLTAVAKGQLNENDSVIKNPKVIFRATPELNSEYHFGSRLLFDKDGYLFVSSGERSVLEGRKQSQWLNSGMGKIFRITKEGKAAPGNPFINQSTAKPEIYSYGHRNPQSLDFDPVTGELWEAEFGPQGGDELNIIKPGKNYGWPIITYGVEYSGSKIGEAIQQKEGMEQPVYFWDPVLSPGGMVFYTGDAIPEWKNNLFICGLSSTRIVRLVIENNKVVGEEALLTDQKERIRDITQYNGVLYAVSDFGILFRISKK
jgi:aldose sugar dehydrogenase